MSLSAYQLILFPQRDDVSEAQRTALLSHLLGCGFLGQAFELDGREHFTTGARFLDQLVFLGCSPHIETEPPADPEARDRAARQGRFCHLHLTRLLPRARFRANPRARVRCPACRKSVAATELLTGSGTDRTCAHCGHEAAITDWNWQGHAGYANLFLEVWGIHPGEAAPTEGFIQTIEKITDSPWSSFYTQAGQQPADETGPVMWHNDRPN
ncbi:MAG: hypothetical protein CMN57_10035 [Gammaproteobacteria bacterium]|nr:hypothetical protein [Gammaproteobacteria bacterium]